VEEQKKKKTRVTKADSKQKKRIDTARWQGGKGKVKMKREFPWTLWKKKGEGGIVHN